MSEMKSLLEMLSRAGIGHGLRRDYSPPGDAVLVEADGDDGGWVSVEFAFDKSGKLKGVTAHPGEEG